MKRPGFAAGKRTSCSSSFTLNACAWKLVAERIYDAFLAQPLVAYEIRLQFRLRSRRKSLLRACVVFLATRVSFPVRLLPAWTVRNDLRVLLLLLGELLLILVPGAHLGGLRGLRRRGWRYDLRLGRCHRLFGPGCTASRVRLLRHLSSALMNGLSLDPVYAPGLVERDV